MTKKPRLLVLGDAPANILQTGNARLIGNILSRVKHYFDEIHIWGINHGGMPHEEPYKIYPGGYKDWYQEEKLAKFLSLLSQIECTHVLLIRELNYLSNRAFPNHIYDICSAQNIKSYLYFVTDSPLRHEWARIVKAVDFPVTANDYGLNELFKANLGQNNHVAVIPHGVDRAVYRHQPDKKKQFRAMLKWKGLCDDDFLFVNVNANQFRKGHWATFQIIAELKKAGHKVKLLMHMPCANREEGLDLAQIAVQYGLEHTRDWIHSDRFFKMDHAAVTEEGLVQIYNAADAYLSTTIGEGFGLPMIESHSCGLPIFVPANTNCLEFVEQANKNGCTGLYLLPMCKQGFVAPNDESRVRHSVDAIEAAKLIGAVISKDMPPSAMSQITEQQFNWDCIAAKWLKLFESPKPSGCLVAWEAEREHLKDLGFGIAPYGDCIKALPSVITQSPKPGAGFFPLSHTADLVEFNPGLCQDQGGRRWLLTRANEFPDNKKSKSHIRVRRLFDDNRLGDHFVLPAPGVDTHNQEDPRVLAGIEQFFVTYVCFPGYWKTNNPKQMLSVFTDKWDHQSTTQIPFGRNRPGQGIEKNWLPFFCGDNLCLVYQIVPHIIIHIVGGKKIVEYRTHKKPSWNWGEPRGGTPPVLIGDLYYSFFHSSLAHQGVKKRYFTACYAFRAEPPHEIVKFSKEPLMGGSAEDERVICTSPLVTFPSGSLYDSKKAEWFIVSGINDERCLHFTIDHKTVLESMVDV